MSPVETARKLLCSVVDPELGLNIVELGLIYDLRIENNRAHVVMTFTTMGCPVAGTLVNEVYAALKPLDLADIKVDITFDPPWEPGRITLEGRQRLGMGG